jgi:hypothetical protein
MSGRRGGEIDLLRNSDGVRSKTEKEMREQGIAEREGEGTSEKRVVPNICDTIPKHSES